MDNSQVLQSIKAALDHVNVDSVIQSPGDVVTQPRLIIYGGTDYKQRNVQMELTVQTIEMAQQFFQDKAEKTQAYVRIQLDSAFPFKVDDAAMGEVSQFLHFLNLQVEVPGFFLDYFDNVILYRYVLLSDRDHIPQKMLLSLIGIVMFFQDAFGQTLERLALGKATFVDVLEEIQKTLAKASDTVS